METRGNSLTLKVKIHRSTRETGVESVAVSQGRFTGYVVNTGPIRRPYLYQLLKSRLQKGDVWHNRKPIPIELEVWKEEGQDKLVVRPIGSDTKGISVVMQAGSIGTSDKLMLYLRHQLMLHGLWHARLPTPRS